MSSDNYREKRKYARLDLRSKINFSITETPQRDAPGGRFKGEGKNIGAEGLLFSCGKELKQGTLLALEIFFPGKPDPVYISGEVRWCAPTQNEKTPLFDIGIKFSSINKNHVLMLIQYVCGNLSVDEVSSLK